MYKKYLKDDLLAGVVVFFVAVPLCLGIAVASGASPIAGLISGIVGGIVVGLISKSQVSVSGPAAGLVAIVLAGIASTGSMAAFGLAVFLSGFMQIGLGFLRAGTIAYFFPSSVVKGMLASIGIIIIMKQFPHFVGYDKDYEGDLNFFQINGHNTFTEFFSSLNYLQPGILIAGVLSLATIFLWDKYKKGALKIIPGALLGVMTGVITNMLYKEIPLDKLIIKGGENGHLVNIPIIKNISEVSTLLTPADFSQIGSVSVWVSAVTIALVASIESLLTIEATDKIDPLKRVTPTNRELVAQGVGNTVSGLAGGLPITSVIIRSSANINSGGRTKVATIFHGMLLFAGTLFFARFLNEIPLTSLAAILLLTGYKLANPKVFREMFAKSYEQWVPFMVTVIAIYFSDLLVGIGIGIAVNLIFLLVRNLQDTHFFSKEIVNGISHIKIILPQDVSFLNKAALRITLDRISDHSHVIIDASLAYYIDYDVLEIIREFVKEKAPTHNINVILKGLKEEYKIAHNFDIEMNTT